MQVGFVLVCILCFSNICPSFIVVSIMTLLDDLTKWSSSDPIDGLSDLTVQLEDGVELRVHRFILAIRSPVFRAMFAHKDTAEANTGRLVVDDISVEVFKLMLDYMYMDKVPEDKVMQHQATELLTVADKYELLEFKSICADWLGKHLTLVNVFNVSLLAGRHSEKELHRKCSSFIVDNAAALPWMYKCTPEQYVSMISEFEHAISLLDTWSSESVRKLPFITFNLIHLGLVAKQCLINWTNVENVCRLLSLAEEKSFLARYDQCHQLQQHCIRYIIDNASSVFKTEGWKTYVVDAKQFNLMEKLLHQATGVSES